MENKEKQDLAKLSHGHHLCGPLRPSAAVASEMASRHSHSEEYCGQLYVPTNFPFERHFVNELSNSPKLLSQLSALMVLGRRKEFGKLSLV